MGGLYPMLAYTTEVGGVRGWGGKFLGKKKIMIM